MIEITDVLHPGVVYLGNYKEGSSCNRLEHMDGPGKLVLKVIYSGLAFEPYGKEVHIYLGEKDMAPKYIFAIEMDGGNLPRGAEVIESHHVMEYLSPPSTDSAGWISLLELGEKFSSVASSSKEDIKAALDDILNVLKKSKFVHGDLRPNNIFISIKVTNPEDCIIQSRPHSKPPLPYLKVIDFDWAGVAGEVKYPPHRNPDVEWPGKSGGFILADHDKIMIDSWLSKWPVINDADGEGDKRGDEATFLRFSLPSM